MKRYKKESFMEALLGTLLVIMISSLGVLHPAVRAEESSILDIAQVLPSVGFLQYTTYSSPNDLITKSFKAYVVTDAIAEAKYFIIDTGVSQKYTMIYIANYA